MRALVVAVLVASVAVARPAAPQAAPARAQGEEVEEVDVTGAAEAADRRWDRDAFAIRDRVINVHTAHPMRHLALEFVVDHRAFEPLKESPLENLLGLNGGGLKVGLALRFGILDLLDVGVARTNRGVDPFNAWDFDVKVRPFSQDTAYLDVAMRAGVTWFEHRRASDDAGWFLQLLATRTLFRGDRLLLSSGLLFHSESARGSRAAGDEAWSLAVPAGVEGRILTWLGVGAEVVTPVAGRRMQYPAVSGAIRFYTHRHTFLLVVSNTQHISSDGVVAGSGRGFGDAVFGFTITREFDF